MVSGRQQPRSELRREDVEIPTDPARCDRRQYDTGRLSGALCGFVSAANVSLLAVRASSLWDYSFSVSSNNSSRQKTSPISRTSMSGFPRCAAFRDRQNSGTCRSDHSGGRNYRPCSRNPVLAQCLSYFHRIEERGSGFRRMRDQMLNHGLDQPVLSTDTGYFQVTFPGPGDNLNRIRVAEIRLLVTPALEAQLNKRQRKIMEHVLETGSVTTGWCMKTFRVVRDTAHRDLVSLVELNMLVPKGAGRGATYVLREGTSAAEIIR